jgi:hypothetical protein
VSLKDFKSWEKQWLVTFKLPDTNVYCLLEDCHYGTIITKWQIGEEPHTTTVDNRYLDRKVECHANSNLIGKREFERHIIIEFLYKPLGLEVPDSEFPIACGSPLYTYYLTFKNAIQDKVKQ